MLTKKHFNHLARILFMERNLIRAKYEGPGLEVAEAVFSEMVKEITYFLACYNPRFDKDRFIRAVEKGRQK